MIAQLNAGLVGRYTIQREIGAGGMATVFLARDLRHDRRVALKVLKPELGAVLGAERFLGEIRVTANLQHPNLLPLFDSGESDGLLFYVMPFVEGETLRARLEREKQLPVDEAVRLAVQLSSALDYAHRQGVIHRDLKPENVLLHDGQPLIADFGIALAITNAGGARVTQTGLSLGTPQYMSPEQAAGDRVIDGRTDIYSLGALTYEMLTGETPHTGTTAQAVIAKLMTEEPRPITTLRRSVPAYVDAAVQRALEKLPADRFATAHELADALSGKTIIALPKARVRASSSRAWRLATAACAVIAVGALAWGMTRSGGKATPAEHVRFALVLPDSAAVDASLGSRSFDLSSDGTQLAYVGANGLFIRSLNDLNPRRLTSESARQPHFSPDGAWVGYTVGGALRKVPVGGGTPLTITDSVGRYGWGSKGTIVFTRSVTRPDLWRVSENGGAAERIVHQLRPADLTYGSPTFLPDGDAFVVSAISAGRDSAELAAYRLSDQKMRYLGLNGGYPQYVDGVLLFGAGGTQAVPFDAQSLRITGGPTTVLQGVMRKLSDGEFAVASNGTMVYVPGTVTRQLVEVDRAGREVAIPEAPRSYGSLRYSPDGRRVAMTVGQPPSIDVWIYDIASRTMSRLTTNGRAATPVWTPDGRRVAWTNSTGASGTFWRAVDGSDAATSLIPGALGLTFSPTGSYAITAIVRENAPSMLSIVQLDSSRRRTPIMESVGPAAARVSPDGRWLAYVQSESGLAEVYVRPLPGPGGRYQVSAGGGTEPVWNPRGGELVYRSGTQLVAARVEFGEEPRVMRRDTLPFRITSPPGTEVASYDVSPNGQRFVMLKPTATPALPIVITGWLDEVRVKMNAALREKK